MEFIAATNNAHKLAEMRRILVRMGHTVLSQREAGVLLEPEETGTTFEENAAIKAQAICEACQKPTIADDSGPVSYTHLDVYKRQALEIQGFKSFPDKTRITIERGITAVVGPNGSGKSNISDAIRWVMGETSAKQLRGGGKMENVIFSGSAQRGPMGFAAVSLVIDNTDRGIDVDADEVVVGRRYYRSGESEYTVNGQNVRLKDIYEMFLDTGLGRDGYSVIGQGRIAEIVGAKRDVYKRQPST